jgi:hypothetical protein
MYVEFRNLGGAFGRVPSDATAFAYRDSEVMITTALLGSPEDQRTLSRPFIRRTHIRDWPTSSAHMIRRTSSIRITTPNNRDSTHAAALRPGQRQIVMHDLPKRIQETIDELVESDAERSLQVAVHQHGDLIVDAVSGVADPATGRAVTSDTPFYVYSTGMKAAADG